MEYAYEDGQHKNDVFQGKLGTSQDYAWLWESLESANNAADITNEMICATVEFHADILYGNYVEELEEMYPNLEDGHGTYTDWQGNEADIDVRSLDDFEAESDYHEVIADLKRRRDEAIDEAQLEAVVTPKEIAEDLGVKEDTVRDAIEHGWLIARKSGATWLILRKHAEKRWACEFCVKAGYIEPDLPSGNALTFDSSGHLARYQGEFYERLTPAEILAVTEDEYQSFRTKNAADYPAEADRLPKSVHWFLTAALEGYAPSVVND